MSKVLLTILLVTLSTAPDEHFCSCRKALVNDVPHGANEDIEYTGRMIKRIYGKVFFEYTDEPVGGAVIEVYDVSEADKNLKTREIMERRERLNACVTGSDKKFFFSDLPSGEYVLRAGTGASGDMNEVYARVTVDRRWWRRWFRSGKAIELGLTPGT
jgi:hypothetical protein